MQASIKVSVETGVWFLSSFLLFVLNNKHTIFYYPISLPCTFLAKLNNPVSIMQRLYLVDKVQSNGGGRGGFTDSQNHQSWSMNWTLFREKSYIQNFPASIVYKHWPDTCEFITRTVELWNRWIRLSCYYKQSVNCIHM